MLQISAATLLTLATVLDCFSTAPLAFPAGPAAQPAVLNSSSTPSVRQCVYCDLLLNLLNFANDATYSPAAEQGLRGLIADLCADLSGLGGGVLDESSVRG